MNMRAFRECSLGEKLFLSPQTECACAEKLHNGILRILRATSDVDGAIIHVAGWCKSQERSMGNHQAHSHHHNGHSAVGNGSLRGKSESGADSSSQGSPPISKEEMETRFSQLVVSVDV